MISWLKTLWRNFRLSQLQKEMKRQEAEKKALENRLSMVKEELKAWKRDLDKYSQLIRNDAAATKICGIANLAQVECAGACARELAQLESALNAVRERISVIQVDMDDLKVIGSRTKKVKYINKLTYHPVQAR